MRNESSLRDRDRGERERGGSAADKELGSASRRTGRRRGCTYCSDDAQPVDYKDPQTLRYYITDRGKIVPRRISGLCAKHQRTIQLAVKRARTIALLPFTSNE